MKIKISGNSEECFRGLNEMKKQFDVRKETPWTCTGKDSIKGWTGFIECETDFKEKINPALGLRIKC